MRVNLKKKRRERGKNQIMQLYTLETNERASQKQIQPP